MLFERPEAGNRAVILDIQLRDQENPSSSEFAGLARSAEIEVVDVVQAKRNAPSPRMFVGSGKADELKQIVHHHDADLVLVNHDITAGQQRNLERGVDCRVITRTELILTIFAARARSHEGQLQVELAQLKHAQTRLVRGWTHLDRQKGGVNMRGAGEKQIELDQRMLSERIKSMEGRLREVSKRRGQNRRSRDRRQTPTVALVGYTNAGKSTLFNQLTHADVYAEDQLFATLDPTMRKIGIPGLNDVVLADTVGFVSLLPHALVEAFKSTLEEVVYADLLLHVVDAADPLHAERMEQVRAVLSEIGADEVPELVLFNKVDLLEDEDSLPGQACSGGAFAISARTGMGLEQLKQGIGEALGVVAPHQVLINAADGKTRAWLYRSGAVLGEEVLEDGQLQLTLQADDFVISQLRKTPNVQLRQISI